MSAPVPTISAWARAASDGDAGDGAPRLSRGQRRDEKKRLHEAQKKARAIDKANDKQQQGRDKQGKKNTDKKQKKRK